VAEINTGHRAGITNPKQQISSVTVEECANSLINIPIKAMPTFFEFNGNAFTLFYQRLEISHLFPLIW
jgi:hypothetical protein